MTRIHHDAVRIYPSLERARAVAAEVQKHDKDWRYVAQERIDGSAWVEVFDEEGNSLGSLP